VVAHERERGTVLLAAGDGTQPGSASPSNRRR
jgi:hypothetical protein